jgi:hypothetical protein
MPFSTAETSTASPARRRWATFASYTSANVDDRTR